MLFKCEYHRIKEKLKYLDRPSVLEICKQAGVSDYEERLIISVHEDRTRIEMCFELSISQGKYTHDLKKAISKLIKYI